MKFVFVANLGLCLALATSSIALAGGVSTEVRADAEYMMRKIVEDIHNHKVTTTVTDKTLDQGITVVGYALEFIAERKDQATGETFSCAQVSLKANIREGKTAFEKIARKDEICTGSLSGTVRYIPNVE
ncbi:MAG: hypothetical protein JKY12_04290 [Sneathiella sp.]|nr:hypothetical protein [Sneathiella sp.]